MELISPLTLWKDYDRKKEPLDVSLINVRIEKAYSVKSFYFNGERSFDGITRIYAKLYLPLGIKKPPVLIYLHDAEVSIDISSTLMQALSGYAFLRLDYSGRKEERERFTIYPKSYRDANYFDNPEIIESIPEDIKASCWYIWTTVALRGITYLENDLDVDSDNIGILGIGVGGSTIFKIAAIESKIKAGMSFYNCGFVRNSITISNSYTKYKACLDPQSYGPYICIPFLEQITSNESDGSIDYMNDVYGAVKNPTSRLSIVERANRNIAVKQRKNVVHWFDYHIKGIGGMPKAPVLASKGSEHHLYYEVKVDESLPIESIELFVAQAMTNGAYRNWSNEKLEKLGDGNYISKVAVYSINEPVYAFVNVKYNKYLSLSSMIAARIPAKMGVHADEIKHSRLIYDSSMGLDDWLVLNDNGMDEVKKLIMGKGPFGITGVYSKTFCLCTFKIGDFAYKGFRDSVLQLLLYSDIKQMLKFTVTVNNKDERAVEFVDYICYRSISPSDNWCTFTLAALDFKSIYGTLDSWDNVATFEVSSEESKGKVLINSMLWV